MFHSFQRELEGFRRIFGQVGLEHRLRTVSVTVQATQNVHLAMLQMVPHVIGTKRIKRELGDVE